LFLYRLIGSLSSASVARVWRYRNLIITYYIYVVGHGKVAPRTAKFNAILDRPKDKKQLRSFLGIAEYYRKLIPHFAEITTCLKYLLHKNKKFV